MYMRGSLEIALLMDEARNQGFIQAKKEMTESSVYKRAFQSGKREGLIESQKRHVEEISNIVTQSQFVFNQWSGLLSTGTGGIRLFKSLEEMSKSKDLQEDFPHFFETKGNSKQMSYFTESSKTVGNRIKEFMKSDGSEVDPKENQFLDGFTKIEAKNPNAEIDPVFYVRPKIK